MFGLDRVQDWITASDYLSWIQLAALQVQAQVQMADKGLKEGPEGSSESTGWKAADLELPG